MLRASSTMAIAYRTTLRTGKGGSKWKRHGPRLRRRSEGGNKGSSKRSEGKVAGAGSEPCRVERVRDCASRSAVCAISRGVNCASVFFIRLSRGENRVSLPAVSNRVRQPAVNNRAIDGCMLTPQ